MAETVDTGLLPRTYFKAPRVPFDFRGVALAILGYLVFWAGGLLLSEIFGKQDVPGAFLLAAQSLFAGIPFIGDVIGRFLHDVFQVHATNLDDYTFWHQLVGGVWFFLVWSFFGQAVHRIVSLRIARDEGLSLVEALKFAAKNWLTVLIAPVIVGLAMAFFYFCNTAGGAVVSIPVLGEVLGLVIIPLQVISTLLLLLIGLGGIFGLPLIGAAAAWERNGSLDAISRAFSYVFARPLQFFWNYFLIFLFIGVILLVGSWFIGTLSASSDLGIWNKDLSMAAGPPMTPEQERSLSNEDQQHYATLRESTKRVVPPARSFQAVLHAPWTQIVNVFMYWVFYNLIWLGIFGYALYWFLGASTCVYADLRADVDGTEEDEIYLEEEEEDFDAFSEAVDRAEPETQTATPPAAPEAPATGSETTPPPSDGGSASEGGETPPAPEGEKSDT